MKRYTIPKDPHMLYSYINVMLRDRYDTLQAFCADNDADIEEILRSLAEAGYEYNESINQFR